jgi:hypothetical protein
MLVDFVDDLLGFGAQLVGQGFAVLRQLNQVKEGEQLAFGEVASAGCAAKPPSLRQAGFTGHSPI